VSPIKTNSEEFRKYRMLVLHLGSV